MKHIRFSFLLFFLLYTHNASSMQIDIEDVEQFRYQNFDEWFAGQNSRIQFLFELTSLQLFDEWFYANSYQDRILRKKSYEKIAEELIRLEDFEKIYLTLPVNYFSKVILNKVYYRQYRKFLDNIDCTEMRQVFLTTLHNSGINISLFVDNYTYQLLLEVMKELSD